MRGLRAGVAPNSLIIATFRNRANAAPKPPEQPGNVYFAIALTTLDAGSGVLNFFPRDGNDDGHEVLEPGDGIICCSEDVNPNGGGEGGVVIIISYQVPRSTGPD